MKATAYSDESYPFKLIKFDGVNLYGEAVTLPIVSIQEIYVTNPGTEEKAALAIMGGAFILALIAGLLEFAEQLGSVF